MVEGSEFFNDGVEPVQNAVVRDSGELSIPMVQNFYNWWNSFAPDVPLKSDFDIVDHASSAANIFMLEVLGVGEYHFKVCGESVVEIVGVNNNGAHFKHIENPADDRERRCNDLVAYYDKIVSDRRCKSCRGKVFFMSTRHHEFESIDCPLVDDDGKVTHLLGVIALVPKPG